MKVYRSAPAFAALALLTACSGANAPAPVMHCPQVDMLEQARTLTLFSPGRADPAARITTAQVTGFDGACQLEKRDHAVLVTVVAGFEADNGPANPGARLALPWFTAITQNDTVIAKTNYTVKLHFASDTLTAVATSKVVKLEFPNIPATDSTQVLIGFTMTPDQLAYTAAHPGAAP